MTDNQEIEQTCNRRLKYLEKLVCSIKLKLNTSCVSPSGREKAVECRRQRDCCIRSGMWFIHEALFHKHLRRKNQTGSHCGRLGQSHLCESWSFSC